MQMWFWLYVAERFLAASCPLTSKVGAVLGVFSLAATFVFVVLVFFLSEHWWYGLLLLAVALAAPFLVPRINPYDCGCFARLYFGVFSHFVPVLVVLMYLSFFGVL